MRKVFFAAAFIAFTLMFVSCSRGITVSDAANGRAKCGRYLR